MRCDCKWPQFAFLNMGHGWSQCRKGYWRVARNSRGYGRTCSTKRNADEIKAMRDSELFEQNMRDRPGPGRSVAVLPRISLDQSNELVERFGLYGGVGQNAERECGTQCYRLKVLVRIIRDAIVECRIDHIRGDSDQQTMTVGCCPCGLTGSDVASGTSDILNHKLPTQLVR